MASPKKTEQGTWRLQIEVRGQRDSGTFATKREALEWGQVRSAEIRSSLAGAKESRKTLLDAMREYAEKVSPTKRGESKEVIRLLALPKHEAFPGAVRLADLTPAHLAAWRDARLKEVARGSVLRDMVLVAHVLEVSRREWGWMQANPMRDVRKPAEPDHRERLISGPEIRGVLRALNWGRGPVRSVSQAVGCCFLVALQTGMRAGELCGLAWVDVHDDYCVLRVSKTGKGRDVPLTPSARRTVEMMQGWDGALVFGLRPQTLDAMFRKYRERAGLAGFTFHDARHTAATRLAQRLHVLDLCKMFGWKTTTRALTYYNPSAGDIARRIIGAPTQAPR